MLGNVKASHTQRWNYLAFHSVELLFMENSKSQMLNEHLFKGHWWSILNSWFFSKWGICYRYGDSNDSRDSDVKLAQEHVVLSLKNVWTAEKMVYKAAFWEGGGQLPLHLLLLLSFWGNNLPLISSMTANLVLQTLQYLKCGKCATIVRDENILTLFYTRHIIWICFIQATDRV